MGTPMTRNWADLGGYFRSKGVLSGILEGGKEGLGTAEFESVYQQGMAMSLQETIEELVG
jgi:hypothetical protein